MKTKRRWKCSSGNNSHDTFRVQATEDQEWRMDADGNYIETDGYGDGRVVSDERFCYECKSPAFVVEEPVPETEVERLTRELAEAKAEIARLSGPKSPLPPRQYHIAKSDPLAMQKVHEAASETVADHGDDAMLVLSVRYDFSVTLDADGVEAWNEAKLNSVLTEHARRRLSDDPNYEPEHWILTEGGSL